MFNLKNSNVIAFIFALTFHFTFYFSVYGPEFSGTIVSLISLLALISVVLMLYWFVFKNWQQQTENSVVVVLFGLYLLWGLFSWVRGIGNINDYDGFKRMFLDPFIGLSLFPMLFFIIGLQTNTFYSVHKVLTFYMVLVWLFSFLYMDKFELQTFLLMPVFYFIILFPLQTKTQRLLTLVIAISTFLISLTNRAAMLRIASSYLIVLFSYLLYKRPLLKKISLIIIVLLLIAPVFFIIQGIRGDNIFQKLSSNNDDYSHENLVADTRTFLYYEVLTDLNNNNAFLFGKGIDAGYYSPSFDLTNRTAVEVGFLQLLLKNGVLGFLLYSIIILTAAFNCLVKSQSRYMFNLGLLLITYYVLLFLENIIAFNIYNILIWIIIGMSHSKVLLKFTDQDFKYLFQINAIKS